MVGFGVILTFYFEFSPFLNSFPERKLNLVNTEINGKKKSLSGGGQVSWGSRVWGGEAWGPDQWKERGTGSLRAGAR